MLPYLRKFSSRLFFRVFYLSKPPWDSGVSPPELIEHIESHPTGQALDLGCGTGTNVITLAKHGWQAEGIDFVPKAIRQARRKAVLAGVDAAFSVGDVTDDSNYYGQYDLILDMGCYHSLTTDQRQQYRQHVTDHLANGGTLMLYGFLSRESGSITEDDVQAFEENLELKRRVNSVDGSGPTSAWFWFGPKESGV
jgi:cyclopropane fatty-acyl-phospholipid synthase-like methyltransferase